MSPEQVRGEDLDGRSDIFSFGAVLYEMATGKMAFDGDTFGVIAEAILNRSPAPLCDSVSYDGTELERIVSTALRKDRRLRYQSAADLRADLQAYLDNTGVGWASERPSSRQISGVFPQTAITDSPHPRQKLLTALLAVTVLVAAGTAFWYVARGTPLNGKDTVVLAEFENGAGDPVFDDTLRTAASVALNQSPFLNVLPENRVVATLQEMSADRGAALNPQIAREVCQRVNGKAYIAGSIRSLGSQYVLSLRAVNCASGDVLAENQVTAAAKEKVLDALGREASELRQRLGESLPSIQKFDVPLAEATTSSLDALKDYSLGAKAYNDQGPVAALPLHRHAITLDPNFAMGYRAVGVDYETLGQRGNSRGYYSKAFELRDRAGELEKLTIAADYYAHVTGESEKVLQTLQAWIAYYPRQGGPHRALGNAYAEAGQYEKSIQETREALSLDPEYSGNYSNLAYYLTAAGRFDEARRILDQAQLKSMDGHQFRSIRYALAFLKADLASMTQQLQWFDGRPEDQKGLALAMDTESFMGRFNKAGELTERAVDAAIRADGKENGAVWLENAALSNASVGNLAQARRFASDGLKLYPGSSSVQEEAALAFAMAGDQERATSLAEDLDTKNPLNTNIQLLWLPPIRAQLALNRGNAAEALKALRASASIEFGANAFSVNLSCLYPTYERGEAYLISGDGTAATAEFQKILDHQGIVWNCWTGSLARLGLARSYALQAQSAAAKSAYQNFLTAWKDADKDLPILKQARSEYAKLQ